MRVTGIDTNVLLSFRLKREPGYKKAANLFEKCLEGKGKIYTPLPVLLETEWVLRYYYKEPKEKIVQFFE